MYVYIAHVFKRYFILDIYICISSAHLFHTRQKICLPARHDFLSLQITSSRALVFSPRALDKASGRGSAVAGGGESL